MPSIVLVAPDQSLHIGWDAATHPHRYEGTHFSINSIKRLMGKTGEITWGALKTYPQEVSALILAAVKVQAEAFLGEEISGTVIAVPAHFDVNQRWATLQAAEIAGLQTLRLVNEATAAMMAWVRARAEREAKEGTGLIFDFGGGTLDVSVVYHEVGVYEVKTTAGDGRLGGDDFDQIIIDWCLRHLKDRLGQVPEMTAAHHLLLRESARCAKEELSSAPHADIHLPGFIRAGARFHDLDMSLDRTEFEALCAPLLERARATLRRALDDVKKDRLDHVILVGGMSRMPCIQRVVRQATGVYPPARLDSPFCVAEGASVCAGILCGDVKDSILLDVVPATYGVALAGGRVRPMIPRNTTIPTRVTQTFTTTQDNQTDLTVGVVEVNDERALTGSRVGELQLSGIPPAKAGVPVVDVTFDIDANLAISICASDRATGREVVAALQAPYRLNPAQMKVLQAKVAGVARGLQQRLVESREARLDDSAHDAAETTAREVEEFLTQPDCPLPLDQRSILTAGSALLRDYTQRAVPREELGKLNASIRHAVGAEVSRCIESAVQAVLDTPGYARWAAGIQHLPERPADVAKTVAALRDHVHTPAQGVTRILQCGRSRASRAWLKQALCAVRASNGPHFCVACLLDDSLDPELDVLGTIRVPVEDRPLVLLVYLRELSQTIVRPRRLAAATMLAHAWKGGTGAPLLMHLAEEQDSDVAARLMRALEEGTSGGWVECLLVGSRTGAVPRRLSLGCIRRFQLRARLGSAVSPFPVPATSNPACRFAAPGFPVRFAPRVMRPRRWGALSAMARSSGRGSR
jgi:molecular chaperone DnaK